MNQRSSFFSHAGFGKVVPLLKKGDVIVPKTTLVTLFSIFSKIMERVDYTDLY